MSPERFVESLKEIGLQHTFNPYLNRCPTDDLPDAPCQRSGTLLALLDAAIQTDIDAIWIGRDLGYRGGRRTGLALTDDVHVNAHAARWGVSAERSTMGCAVSERTAVFIWNALARIDAHIFLWNVFPFHPHKPEEPFSNRKHNAVERNIGEEILSQLIQILRPKRLVAIGNNAAESVRRLDECGVTIHVRHPSYGGQVQFTKEIHGAYRVPYRTKI